MHGLVFDRYGTDTVFTAVGVYLWTFGISAAFSLWVTRRLGLPSLLLLADVSPRLRWRRFVAWGVVPGLAISLINALLYSSLGAAAPPSVDVGIQSHLDIVVLSAYAATWEETFYRLFAIPFLVAVGMRLRGWSPAFSSLSRRPAEPPVARRPPGWLVALAVLATAILFGLSHQGGLVRATGFGILLGLIFLRGGWESAVTAHFLGNYLLFAGIYL